METKERKYVVLACFGILGIILANSHPWSSAVTGFVGLIMLVSVLLYVLYKCNIIDNVSDDTTVNKTIQGIKMGCGSYPSTMTSPFGSMLNKDFLRESDLHVKLSNRFKPEKMSDILEVLPEEDYNSVSELISYFGKDIKSLRRLKSDIFTTLVSESYIALLGCDNKNIMKTTAELLWGSTPVNYCCSYCKNDYNDSTNNIVYYKPLDSYFVFIENDFETMYDNLLPRFSIKVV